VEHRRASAGDSRRRRAGTRRRAENHVRAGGQRRSDRQRLADEYVKHGVYGNSYFKRAIVAQLGLGANQPEDAIYPLNVADADGKPVTADNRYVMHFDKAKLPPVNAFWSLTMYDAEGFQVANPINRFAIGDRDALKFNPDGSLDLYIQHDDPGTISRRTGCPRPRAARLG